MYSESKLDYYIGLANYTSTRSKDPSTKVGCVFVKDDRQLVSGFNGFVSGDKDSYENITRDEKLASTLHAELNAVLVAAKFGIRLQGAHCFVTLSPCSECVKMLHQLGIEKIYFISRGVETDARWKSTNLDKYYYSELINNRIIELTRKELRY